MTRTRKALAVLIIGASSLAATAAPAMASSPGQIVALTNWWARHGITIQAQLVKSASKVGTDLSAVGPLAAGKDCLQVESAATLAAQFPPPASSPSVAASWKLLTADYRKGGTLCVTAAKTYHMADLVTALHLFSLGNSQVAVVNKALAEFG